MQFEELNNILLNDKYLLQKMIGTGNYGQVYLATVQKNHPIYEGKLVEVVAVKVVYHNKLQSRKEHELLNNEIENLATISSPYVIKLFDNFKDEDHTYLVLEYCENGNFEDYLKQRNMQKMPERMLKKIYQQILYGIQELHSKRILHRDIKLNNILIKGEMYKLGDLGFSRKFNANNIYQTSLGTPVYMAPEILQMEKYGIEAELYSVGVLFYQILMGEVPFKAENKFKLAKVIEKQEISFNYASQQLKDLIQRMLKFNANDRIKWSELMMHDFFQNDENENRFMNSSHFEDVDAKKKEILHSKMYKTLEDEIKEINLIKEEEQEEEEESQYQQQKESKVEQIYYNAQSADPLMNSFKPIVQPLPFQLQINPFNNPINQNNQNAFNPQFNQLNNNGQQQLNNYNNNNLNNNNNSVNNQQFIPFRNLLNQNNNQQIQPNNNINNQQREQNNQPPLNNFQQNLNIGNNNVNPFMRQQNENANQYQQNVGQNKFGYMQQPSEEQKLKSSQTIEKNIIMVEQCKKLTDEINKIQQMFTYIWCAIRNLINLSQECQMKNINFSTYIGPTLFVLLLKCKYQNKTIIEKLQSNEFKLLKENQPNKYDQILKQIKEEQTEIDFISYIAQEQYDEVKNTIYPKFQEFIKKFINQNNEDYKLTYNKDLRTILIDTLLDISNENKVSANHEKLSFYEKNEIKRLIKNSCSYLILSIFASQNNDNWNLENDLKNNFEATRKQQLQNLINEVDKKILIVDIEQAEAKMAQLFKQQTEQISKGNQVKEVDKDELMFPLYIQFERRLKQIQ